MTKSTIQELACSLESVVNNLAGVDQVSFVAHSMGNIVVRNYLYRVQNCPNPPQVQFCRMVMISELWIYDNFEQLQVPLSIQLGASFDFLAGTAKRAPKFWQMIGCEWLYRALSDPKRLLPRYGKNIMFLAGLMVHEIAQAWKGILKSLPKP